MLPPDGLLSLLPRRPSTYAVVGPAGDWPAVLERLGASSVSPDAADLVVVTRGRPDVRAGVVLDVTGRRRRAGPGRSVARYAVRRGDGDAVELAPGGRGRRHVTVDAAGSVRPASLEGFGPCTRVRIGSDPRRRVALFADGAVVKVVRDPGEGGRAEAEQAVLTELERLGVGHVPRPLGSGVAGGLPWSAESCVLGSALDTEAGVRCGRDALDVVATWLADVADRTRVSAAPDPLPLRGPHTAAALPSHLEVGAVLQHGDLASGTNVLVGEGGRLWVIDWETAQRHGTPLVDLLPLLCLGAARARGARGAEAEADVALRLCRGEDEESPWLFEHVRTYAAAATLPDAAIGSLAALAWAYQASMRLVHEELVLAAGGSPRPWTSPAELVAAAWSEDPRLGPSWPSSAQA